LLQVCCEKRLQMQRGEAARQSDREWPGITGHTLRDPQGFGDGHGAVTLGSGRITLQIRCGSGRAGLQAGVEDRAP